MKLLAIQFKYFGDAGCCTPRCGDCTNIFPIANCTCSCRKKSRRFFSICRGSTASGRCRAGADSASLRQTWPVVRALRREHFDRSVDFASNDRGAI